MSRQVRPGQVQGGPVQGVHQEVPSGPFVEAATELDADEYTTLWEFDLTSGGIVTQTLHKSIEGIRTPSADYEDQLRQVGTITRQIGPFEQPYSTGNCSVTLANENLEFSKLAAGQRFIGRNQRLKFGLIKNGLAAMRLMFPGRCLDWSISNGLASFECRDTGADRFNTPLRSFAKTLNPTVFPDLPGGRPEVLINIIYGDNATNGGNMASMCAVMLAKA